MNPSQAQANRRNATLSTGPVTPEEKRRASLNALSHGLTGQTVVLPSDDLAAYQKHSAQFHTELKPQGLLETKTVQTIADTYKRTACSWRCARSKEASRPHPRHGEQSVRTRY